jgi:hypothetical protein
VDHAVEAYLDAVCRQAIEPVRQLVEQMHRQASAAAEALDQVRNQAGESDAQHVWQAARSHRQAVRELLEEATSALERTHAGLALAQARRALTDALATHAGAQADASRVAPDTLFAPAESDSLYVGSRKAMARGGRRLRRRAPEQQIPAAHLARYHATVRLPLALVPTFSVAEQHVARAVATIETLATAAAYDAMRAEQCARRAELFVHDRERDAADQVAPITPLAGSDNDHADGNARPAATQSGTTASMDALARAHASTLKLRDALAAQVLDVDELREQASAAVRRAQRQWEDDVTQGGTFLLPLRRRPLDRPSAVERFDREDEAWLAWHDRVAHRLGSLGQLLALPDAAHQALDTWIDLLRADVVAPLHEVVSSAAQRVTDRVPTVEQAFGVSAEQARGEVSRALDEALAAAAQAQHAVEDLELIERVEAGGEAFARAIRRLPERVPERVRVNELHSSAVATGAEPVRPTIDVLVETPRAHVSKAVEAEWEALSKRIAQPTVDALRRLEKELAEVPAVLRFNLDTALSTIGRLLQPPDDSPLDPDDEPPADAPSPDEALAEARDLATGGLRRSAVRLIALDDPLARTLVDSAEAAVRPVDRLMSRVIDRSRVEEGLRAQAADAQREALDQVRDTAKQLREGAATVWWGTRARSRLLRLRIKRLLRRGRRAVGVGSPPEVHELGTVEAIAGLDSLLERLPTPYRHLFSLRPLSDVGLLKGRTADLARIRRHEAQWRGGLRNALILSGAAGSGLTSLVKVTEREVLTDYTVSHVDLRSRPRSADALAARLARALGLAADAGASLADLRSAVHAQPADAPPRAVVLSGMDHLMLRTIGGADMARDLLLFLSQTDTRVFWLGTIGASGWQALTRALPQASSLVLSYAVGGLSRAALEEAIMARHTRSGLALHFEPIRKQTSKAERVLLTVRKGDVESQAGLRALFFDELYRLSGYNLTLALVYWLRSVEVDAEGETVHVRQPERLSFAFLDAFDRAGAFALKAFLDHRSLTTGEMAAVMGGAPLRAAIEQFERLGNVMLIEPMPRAKSSSDENTSDTLFGSRPPEYFASDASDVRYRLRPVVVQPVVEYLRRQNVLRT